MTSLLSYVKVFDSLVLFLLVVLVELEFLSQVEDVKLDFSFELLELPWASQFISEDQAVIG